MKLARQRSPARSSARSPTRSLRAIGAAVVSLAAFLVVVGCGDKAAAPAAGGAGAPPPPAVGVITVATQAVPLQSELPGRVEPLRTAQVRARVNGVVLQRQFREGSEVRAGQPLFRIDAAPYQAALDSALAQQARAEVLVQQTGATVARYAPLAADKAISQQDLVNAQAAQKSAEADLAAAKAAVQSARISVGYTQVNAPISGRIGRALVTEGALVSATEATQLALIQQTQQVYVNFTQSSNEVLALRRALAAGQIKRAAPSGNGDVVAVRVVLEDGTELPQSGRLLFSDITVDAGSGQVTLRAEVNNPEGLLLPGQYVRVRLAQAELPAGILIPQQAVTRAQSGDTVLVVGEGNKPQTRPIRVRGAQGGQWVVTEGLKAGDRVIVDGFQKMFAPGAPVNPVPWAPASAASAPASAPASAASR
jgi:membrane fusion protein (multidrug efflux system)